MRHSWSLCVAAALASTGFVAARPFDTIINVPPDPSPTSVLTSNTQVNVFDGGMLGNGVLFGGTGLTNIELNVASGVVGTGLSMRSGSRFNLSGGSIGRGVVINPGAALNITGGEIGFDTFASTPSLSVLGSSTAGIPVSISGGRVARGVDFAGATVSVSGGELAFSPEFRGSSFFNDGLFNVRLRWSATLDISGGYVGAVKSLSGSSAERNTLVTLRGGFVDSSFGPARLNIVGGEFTLNGLEVTSLDHLAFGDLLTGTLSDGSVVIFNTNLGDLFTPKFVLSNTTLMAADLPPSESPVINVIEPGDVAPKGVRAGQTLNLGPDRSMTAFGAVDATVNIAGTVGVLETARSAVNVNPDGVITRMELHAGTHAVINPGATVDQLYPLSGASVVTSGTIPHVRVDGGSLTVTGGQVGGNQSIDEFMIVDGGVLNVAGGLLLKDWFALSSQVSVSGGTIGTPSVDAEFYADASQVNISGGHFISSLALIDCASTISGGTFTSIDVLRGQMTILGRSFALNGVDFSDELLPNQPFLLTDRTGVLSGVLFDGSPFSFELASFSGATTLNVVIPAPASSGLLGLAGLLVNRRRR